MAISPTEIRQASPPASKHLELPSDRSWVRIFRIPPDDEDGHEVEIYVQRMPARFYRVRVPALGLDLTTGSSQEELVADLTNAFITGMLGASE